MTDLLDPMDITLTAPDGREKTFILSKFPALAGREIVCGYPLGALNGAGGGDYQVSEALMLKLMSYVAVPTETGKPLRLSTRALVDNHVPDWWMLVQLEKQMLEHNCSFFGDGRASTFFAGLARTGMPLISKILMGFLEQLLPKDGQPSTN